ncbi:MAG: hypothetical protein B6244_06810 [Candidatus Cloacimonetes bacterium 4572_55]|nr:MAG: hypothetical protein B6244_06810 [Candidatus Cloacimonetes bacterium 4572_55]
MKQTPITVLLVDDSPIALVILKRMLSGWPEIKVVGAALNGKQAIEMIPDHEPDVICTDLNMPIMDGFQFIKEVMTNYPRPILVVSNAVQKENTDNIFRSLEAGAIDVFPKPRGGMGLRSNYNPLTIKLIKKITALSKLNMNLLSPKNARSRPRTSRKPSVATRSYVKMVCIGGSIGGPKAIQKILSSLPPNFPAPISGVIHISEGFLPQFISWVSKKSFLNVKIAEVGEVPRAGFVYFPPENKHLEFDADGGFFFGRRLPHLGRRPSISVTFNSAAERFKRKTVGVLLTGIGKDGVDGMASISKAGGITIVQDEKSSLSFETSRKIVGMGAIKHILPLDLIAPTLKNLIKVV